MNIDNIYLTNATGAEQVNSQKDDSTYTVTHVNANDTERISNVFYGQAVKSLLV